jgi:hypothetical protein
MEKEKLYGENLPMAALSASSAMVQKSDIQISSGSWQLFKQPGRPEIALSPFFLQYLLLDFSCT